MSADEVGESRGYPPRVCRPRHCNLRENILGQKDMETKTYNTEDSLVVTDPTTSSALTSLSRGERTGSRVFLWIWSYVEV